MTRTIPSVPIPAVCAGLLVLALTACGVGTGYESTPFPRPSTQEPAPSAAASTTPAPDCGDPLASYAPGGSLPGPGSLPSGSYMAEIRERGRLIAGVSADTLLFGARNPFSGRIEGFDIDMLKAVSTALFGRDDRIEFRVITAAQRIPLLQDGSVDIVARNMTINCARWADVAFSSEYFRAGQKVLVRRGARADGRAVDGVEDLAGLKVCAPKGSTSLENLTEASPDAVPVGADTHTGCLVRFQQGEVDAITGDDAILAGLAAQDPYARVVGSAFSTEPYGLAISAEHPDFVRFVNGVLERVRDNGDWKASYDRWLAADLGAAPAPPRPVYGRRS